MRELRAGLDPRTPGKRRLGDMEFSSNWMPLVIVLFLGLTAILARTGSAALLVFSLAVGGIGFVFKNLQ